MFNKKTYANTQEFANVEIHLNTLVRPKQKMLVGGVICPDINIKLLTTKQKNNLNKNFALALTRAGKHQLKRESMPVDLSEVIMYEIEKREKISDPICKDLQNSYIELLKEESQQSSDVEEIGYILLFERYNGEGDIEEQEEYLLDRLNSLKNNLVPLLKEGYQTSICTGEELVQLLEVTVNNAKAKINRFVKESPEFIIQEELEDVEELIKQYKTKED